MELSKDLQIALPNVGTLIASRVEGEKVHLKTVLERIAQEITAHLLITNSCSIGLSSFYNRRYPLPSKEFIELVRTSVIEQGYSCEYVDNFEELYKSRTNERFTDMSLFNNFDNSVFVISWNSMPDMSE